MTDKPLEDIVDPDETKEIVIADVLPTCFAKQYEVKLLERGDVIIRPDACTHNCNGIDTECIFWIRQYGPDSKGWYEEKKLVEGEKK